MKKMNAENLPVLLVYLKSFEVSGFKCTILDTMYVYVLRGRRIIQ